MNAALWYMVRVKARSALRHGATGRLRGQRVTPLTRDANGLAAFDKPFGVLSHPNASQDEPRALLTCRYDREAQCFQWTTPDGAPIAGTPLRGPRSIELLVNTADGVDLVYRCARCEAEQQAQVPNTIRGDGLASLLGLGNHLRSWKPRVM